ncbi:Hypothetical_protein [Hexamita inflata]|uniref:Hypothetical_protein n=1 Tax=Hexamita inflata TaxID=28002 RepID=A0AA86PRE1_9EUKA|nr:Hypothetical protein HINF_LOCUS31926 [Hexamita inflata]CAI9963607.1 Hypothetical protein HINF_LOCUS51252 [Hexamita inflata]
MCKQLLIIDRITTYERGLNILKVLNQTSLACECPVNTYSSFDQCVSCPAFSSSVQNSIQCTCDSGSLVNSKCPCPVEFNAPSSSCNCQFGFVILNNQCVLCAVGSGSSKINSVVCVANLGTCGTKTVYSFRDISCASGVETNNCGNTDNLWTTDSTVLSQRGSHGREQVRYCCYIVHVELRQHGHLRVKKNDVRQFIFTLTLTRPQTPTPSSPSRSSHSACSTTTRPTYQSPESHLVTSRFASSTSKLTRASAQNQSDQTI